jgi:hypothetical protein
LLAREGKPPVYAVLGEMVEAELDSSRRFIELGGAIIGLAVLARSANRWGPGSLRSESRSLSP